jgi:formate hydrogenlyase subunit 3/multisubunit Na+/H+ antiporter MnhD subunit
MRIGTILIIAILLVLLGASAWFAYDGLTVGDDTAVSGHAYVAMGLGIFFSLVIGVGLMVLLFYSSRRGYDEPAKLIDDNKDSSE